MSPEDWDNLFWYEQMIYLNGFREEGILKRGDEDESEAPAQVPTGGQSGGRKIDLTSADLSELGDSFTVRRAG